MGFFKVLYTLKWPVLVKPSVKLHNLLRKVDNKLARLIVEYTPSKILKQRGNCTVIFNVTNVIHIEIH